MAKYIIEYDSETHELTANRDGVEIVDVSSVYACRCYDYDGDEDEFYMNINTRTKIENEDDSRTVIETYTRASLAQPASDKLKADLLKWGAK